MTHGLNIKTEVSFRFKVGDIVEDRYGRQYIVIENIEYLNNTNIIKLYDIKDEEYDRMLETSLKLIVR